MVDWILNLFTSARKVSESTKISKDMYFSTWQLRFSCGCTYLRFGDGVKGLSGLFGGRLPGRPFPGGGAGFLGGTSGAAGLAAL